MRRSSQLLWGSVVSCVLIGTTVTPVYSVTMPQSLRVWFGTVTSVVYPIITGHYQYDVTSHNSLSYSHWLLWVRLHTVTICVYPLNTCHHQHDLKQSQQLFVLWSPVTMTWKSQQLFVLWLPVTMSITWHSKNSCLSYDHQSLWLESHNSCLSYDH